MCELFGVSAQKKIKTNELLKEFFSHSVRHPNGWGLAFFFGNAVSLEKEPVTAIKSKYLKERLRHKIEATTMMAHIRLATRGTMEYENCHPFLLRDSKERTWTLMHNGTVFEGPQIDRYIGVQEGATDSERILRFIVDMVNVRQRGQAGPLNAWQRFDVLLKCVESLAPRAKLNLMVYDGDLFYTHTNYAGSLHMASTAEGKIFATTPLGGLEWEPLELNVLSAWRLGELVYQSEPHLFEYVDNEEDQKYLFADYAEL